MSEKEKQTETENTVAKTDKNKPWQFQPGMSGNPSGKPKGAVHKATQAAMILLNGESESLTRKAVELAMDGDTTALKLCLDRIAPTLKSTAPLIKIDMPKQDGLADMAKAFITAAASGDIAIDLAAQLVSAVANLASVEEKEDIKHRLESLERAIEDK